MGLKSLDDDSYCRLDESLDADLNIGFGLDGNERVTVEISAQEAADLGFELDRSNTFTAQEVDTSVVSQFEYRIQERVEGM
jgi:hypothetical protein